MPFICALIDFLHPLAAHGDDSVLEGLEAVLCQLCLAHQELHQLTGRVGGHVGGDSGVFLRQIVQVDNDLVGDGRIVALGVVADAVGNDVGRTIRWLFRIKMCEIILTAS